MIARLSWALAVALASAPIARAATLDVKPGEWETTTKAQTKGSLIPKDALEKMTPEVRAQLEARMKAHQDRMAQGETRRTCVTQEKLDKAFAERGDAGENCQRQVVSSTSKRLEVVVTCTGEHPYSSQFVVEAVSREKVHVTGHFTGENGELNMQGDGRWVGATCSKSDDAPPLRRGPGARPQPKAGEGEGEGG